MLKDRGPFTFLTAKIGDDSGGGGGGVEEVEEEEEEEATDGFFLLSLRFGFSLYLFYNNHTQLQIGPEVILLGGESIRNIFCQGKPLEFLP